jgi:hypothetical protein
MYLCTTRAISFDHIPLDKRAQLLAGLAEVEIPNHLASKHNPAYGPREPCKRMLSARRNNQVLGAASQAARSGSRSDDASAKRGRKMAISPSFVGPAHVHS